MIRKILMLLIITLLINRCAVFYNNASVGFQGEKLAYPISFSSYLYDEMGHEVKAGSAKLKRVKHFEIILDKNVKTFNVASSDISDTLNSIVKKYNGDGIVNLEFSKPVVGGGYKALIKYILGQLGGSLLSSVGIYYFTEKENTKGIIFLGTGIAAWVASTFYIKDNVKVIIKGVVVKWRK